MTPAAIVWFWRGLRGRSVTFAALFASVMLGASIAGAIHHLLRALGVHWLFVLILPAVLFTWLARNEARWMPDERRRVLLARSLLLGSIGLAILIAALRPARPARVEPAQTPAITPGDLPRR